MKKQNKPTIVFKKSLGFLLALIFAFYSFTVYVTADPWLQDSARYLSGWDSSFAGYNCYAFAINYPYDFYWPGKFSDYTNPDVFSSVFDDLDIADLAMSTANDLKSSTLSQICVSIYSTYPTTFYSDRNYICIRRGDEDFHYMKYSNGVWYHKPGGTEPLRYLYTPSNSVIWSNERLYQNNYYSPNTYYDSEIRYIAYKSTHNITSTNVYTGYNYHIGRFHYYEYGDYCSDCHTYCNTHMVKQSCSGPPCNDPYVVPPVNE